MGDTNSSRIIAVSLVSARGFHWRFRNIEECMTSSPCLCRLIRQLNVYALVDLERKLRDTNELALTLCVALILFLSKTNERIETKVYHALGLCFALGLESFKSKTKNTGAVNRLLDAMLNNSFIHLTQWFPNAVLWQHYAMERFIFLVSSFPIG